MVKVINYETRTNDNGEEFNVLIVQGGATPVLSRETGKIYLTAKKASIPCTFDAETCNELINTNLEGKVVKVITEPYSYTVEETGETIEIDYRYEYQNEDLLIEQEHMVGSKEVV
jgi:hypothetical protein